MAELYKLENTIKHYGWGSPEMIPALTGTANPSGEPWAELWMGIHPEGPSKIIVQGKTTPLSELVELPFLLKFLAAETPLSVQAHPNLIQARAGFERENKAGIALSAPERNYRDPNHKPEIVCALTPFTAMAGFREMAETEQLLSMAPGTERLISSLKDGYESFLSALFGLSGEERKKINDFVCMAASENTDTAAVDKNNPQAFLRLCGKLARIYPNDPGILSPLYLNVIELKPSEAIFIPAGILHAYIHGLALECMANSDNVLRGGLTPKHIDQKELFSILSFKPHKPELLKPVPESQGCYGFRAPCKEFTLCLLNGSEKLSGPEMPDGSNVELKAPEMGIAAVTEGAVDITVTSGKTGQKKLHLNRGESAFIGRREPGEGLFFSGEFALFAALTAE